MLATLEAVLSLLLVLEHTLYRYTQLTLAHVVFYSAPASFFSRSQYIETST
jgi:hypothetical protein